MNCFIFGQPGDLAHLVSRTDKRDTPKGGAAFPPRPDVRGLHAATLNRLFPDLAGEYTWRGWRMFPRLDRVYVNERARADLGRAPRYDFRSVLGRLKADDPRSPLARAVGAKGYHAGPTGVYTVR